jgi:hypothetical protein
VLAPKSAAAPNAYSTPRAVITNRLSYPMRFETREAQLVLSVRPARK